MGVITANTETNEIRTVESSATGTYTIGPLRVGLYQLAVERDSFKRAVVTGLKVSAHPGERPSVRPAQHQPGRRPRLHRTRRTRLHA